MTEYRRCQGKSYMIMNVTEAAGGYEYPMLTENKIAGLLPLQISGADGQMQLWYDISGRQSAADKIQIKKPGSDFLKNILTSLMLAVRGAGEYLLHEDKISLDPERIFMDAGEQEILFCYEPFAKSTFTESARAFMEYYISCMEHGDRESARKCYEVYEKCQQDNVSMEELLAILYEGGFEKQEGAWEEPEQEPEEKQDAAKAMPIDVPAKAPEKKRINMLSFLDEWKGKRRMSQKKRTLREPYLFEPEEYQEKPAGTTVFLGSETEQTIGELRYEGDGNAPNLRIKPPVFLIGSRAQEADGVIADDTVSRVHAKITKEADGYYLEDMNSTNGTYHNGELLNYKEKALLAKNDRIAFAKELYRFV